MLRPSLFIAALVGQILVSITTATGTPDCNYVTGAIQHGMFMGGDGPSDKIDNKKMARGKDGKVFQCGKTVDAKSYKCTQKKEWQCPIYEHKHSSNTLTHKNKEVFVAKMARWVTGADGKKQPSSLKYCYYCKPCGGGGVEECRRLEPRAADWKDATVGAHVAYDGLLDTKSIYGTLHADPTYFWMSTCCVRRHGNAKPSCLGRAVHGVPSGRGRGACIDLHSLHS